MCMTWLNVYCVFRLENEVVVPNDVVRRIWIGSKQCEKCSLFYSWLN